MARNSSDSGVWGRQPPRIRYVPERVSGIDPV